MLHSIVLKVRAEEAAELPPTHGHQAHALFLRLLEAADPRLAGQLHDQQQRKPFTVASVHLPARQRTPVTPGRVIWLRVTLLDDALFGPFVARFLRSGTAGLRLGAMKLAVEEVIGTPEGHPMAGYAEFGDLLAGAGSARDIGFEYLSPTAFSLGQAPGGKKRMSVLPEPALVFDSLLRKWNQFAPSALSLDPALRQSVEAQCMVAQHELRTAMFQFPRHFQVGFIGECRYSLQIDDGACVRALNALSDFSFYAGVGYKTTMGMGQTRRVLPERSRT